jgi:D-amino peptidase
MKVYIRADIEGVTGVTHWDEADRQTPDHKEFKAQMTAEVAAACEGALRTGAAQVWVKDAHSSAGPILPQDRAKCRLSSVPWPPVCFFF